MGEFNSLPLEIFAMTTNVTSPALYALGTVTTAFSLLVIGLFLAVSQRLQRRTSHKIKIATTNAENSE